MNENILIENAILAFLHHYPEHNWVGEYKILLEKIKNAKSKDTTVQKRGRPAKRARKKETTSNTTIKKTNQTTTKET